MRLTLCQKIEQNWFKKTSFDAILRCSVDCKESLKTIFSPFFQTESKKSLLFSEHWRGIIFQVNLEGNDHRAAPLPIDHLRGLSAVGFDPVEELVYFAEYAPGIIQRSHLNGSDAETIVNGIYYANRLAIDHLTRNIYFSDSSKYRIDVATLDGMHRTGLISTVWPEGIALDLKNG